MTAPLVRTAAQFRILGPLEVEVGRRSIDIGGRRAKSLLALLALRANEAVSVDELIEVVWGSRSPSAPAKALHVHVFRLRHLLGAGRIATTHSGYSLVAAADELDVSRFRALVAEGRDALRRDEPESAVERLTDALALWRGRALPELADSCTFAGEVERLEEERLAALEDRIEAQLAAGRHGELVPELETLAAANPLRERLTAQLMLAFYRTGRQAEALETYGRVRRRLVDELGLEPGPVLADLHQKILVQDPALAPPTPAAPVSGRTSRRLVTVVLVTFSPGSRLDPETAKRVLRETRASVRGVLEREGGPVDEPLGDAVVAVFGLPAANEDDPYRALGAAAAVTSTLAEGDVAFRIAIDTVEALTTDERLVDDQIPGWMIELAHAAGECVTVLGPGTRRVTRGSVELAPTEVGDAWQLIRYTTPDDAVARRFDAPLVGRDAEIARLRQSLEWIGSRRSCHLVTLVGVAGIGKSRLARELIASSTDDATFLVGRCLAYGGGAFWPLAEMVREVAGDTRPESLERLLVDLDDMRALVDQLAAALGTGEASRAEDAFWAFRKLFAHVAHTRPVALVFEDLHWAEERLLDFIEHLLEWTKDVPILVLGLARPEFLEERPSWGTVGSAETMRLDPLSERSSGALIDWLGGVSSGAERARVLERAEGNPLFIEQLVALVADDPDADADAIPPTLHGVLAARVDRLSVDERRLLECASIIGLEFSLAGVAALAEELEGAAAPEVVARLIRKDLLRPRDAESRRDDWFRFRHILIRDVVYESILKATRAELHERFARWLEEDAEARAVEIDELVGYHLERAVQLRREIDPNAKLEALADEAGERLVSAGRRALSRADTLGAIDLLTRAIALLSQEHDAIGGVLADLSYVYRLAGQWDAARRALAEGSSLAASRQDVALAAYLTTSELQLRLHTEPDFTLDEFIERASKALAVLEDLRETTLAAATRVALAWPYALRGQNQRAEELIIAGYTVRDRESRKLLPSVWLSGPVPVSEAVKRCEALLAEDPPPRTAASCYRALALLAAMSRRLDEARHFVRKDKEIIDALGLPVLSGAISSVRAEVELIAGEWAAAEEILRSGMAELKKLGATMYSGSFATLLARALYAQGRQGEAWEIIRSAEQGAIHDVAHEVGWREIRSRLLIHSRCTEEARREADAALALARSTDSPDLQADALVASGEVLIAIGQVARARKRLSEAIGLYSQKENVVSEVRARSILDRC